MALQRIRTYQRTAGGATLNLRQGSPISDVLRRAFLRAYAHQALGLTRILSYAALAHWLTEQGYPTKDSEARSAKSQKLVMRCVPRVRDVMDLWHRLQALFPAADLELLLEAEGERG